jgi:alkylation response protein AidB-like acyl-CoA dehydrogenase
MLGSAVLATQALLASADEAACERLLPGLASGSKIAAVGWTTAAGRWGLDEVACQAGPAVAARDAWSLTGEAHFVLDGYEADVLLVPALMPDGGICLFEVSPAQPAVTRTMSTTMDESRRLSVARLDGAAGHRIGDRVDLDSVRTAAAIAMSAEQVGAASAALALTVAYAKVRVQFGRPIGSFQALQHRMAEMHVLVESARSLSYAAAEAARASAPDGSLRAAAVKAYCSEALGQVTAEMIQLHGAIGMTWEHTAHRYFKRGHGDAFLLGAPASHVAAIAAAVIDLPAH